LYFCSRHIASVRVRRWAVVTTWNRNVGSVGAGGAAAAGAGAARAAGFFAGFGRAGAGLGFWTEALLDLAADFAARGRPLIVDFAYLNH